MNSISIFSKFGDVQRVRQIFTVLARHGYGHLIEKLGLSESPLLGIILPQPSQQTATNPQRLRQVLEELGPTFVKFGQILSTRPDLIPPAYTEEFSKLQDNVPPFPFEEVEHQVRIELSAEIEDLFTYFDSKPIASASLSQVHRGNLKDGTMVAVKVQRPRIRPLIESDIDLLYLLARITEESIPELNLYTPKKVVREFERAIMRELDFTIEAANAERFRTSFNGNSDIYFPKIYDELSSKRILTMDFVEGVKITDAPLFGYDPKLVARLGLRAVIEMIFRDGFFHADPHPGNVLVMEGGRLAYLDLGLAGRVSGETRDKMLLLLLAIAREDFDEVAQTFYKIGIKERDVDMPEFRADVIHICEKHFGKPLKYMELGSFIKDIIEGSFRHRIRIPYEYALMCKALITMEGVGKSLDPEINIFKESHPYLVEIFKKRYAPDRVSKDMTKTLISLIGLLQEAPPQIKGILDSLERGGLKVRVEDSRVEKKAFRWETIINRLILAALSLTLLLASIVLTLFGKSAWATFLSLVGFSLAGFFGLWLIISILRSGRF
ncbi:MAG: ABC1 kinase family protein [Thermodesulfobacteriota bacterium]